MARVKPAARLIGELRKIASEIEALEVEGDHQLRKFKKQLEDSSLSFLRLAEARDPVRRPKSVFDPTDPKVAGGFPAIALVSQPREALEKLSSFYGSGVYAIYYRGAFPAYAPLVKSEHPVYVGVADPKQHNAKDPVSQGTKLFGRLNEHARSIRNTSSLSIADFDCRFLVVATGWQKAAETYLIRLFKPIWNREIKICYGIGKHGDSAKTRGNRRSPWDTMHPGRGWAAPTAQNQKSVVEITSKIDAHFAAHPPYKSKADVIVTLLQEMEQRA